MNAQRGSGGVSLPSGELTTMRGRDLRRVLSATAELRACHLRPDPHGQVFLRRPFEDEKSFRDRIFRRMFQKEGALYVPHSIIKDHGVIADQVVTTAGVQFLATAFLNTVEPEVLNFHGSGTGAVAEAIGDTALGTEVETRATGTQSNPGGGTYRTIGTVAYTATRAITEHGIFSASTVGTLWDRSVFTAINVVNGDSIQFTYTLTISAGG